MSAVADNHATDTPCRSLSGDIPPDDDDTTNWCTLSIDPPSLSDRCPSPSLPHTALPAASMSSALESGGCRGPLSCICHCLTAAGATWPCTTFDYRGEAISLQRMAHRRHLLSRSCAASYSIVQPSPPPRRKFRLRTARCDLCSALGHAMGASPPCDAHPEVTYSASGGAAPPSRRSAASLLFSG